MTRCLTHHLSPVTDVLSNDARCYKHSAPPERRRAASGLLKLTEEVWSGRRGSNSQLSAWESEFSFLYFQYLQKRSRKINVHATHTVHALPDLRVAGGTFGGRCVAYADVLLRFRPYRSTRQTPMTFISCSARQAFQYSWSLLSAFS